MVGSIAGVLPPAKSLFYRLFSRKDIAERPHDSRITAFSKLIANKGDCATPTIDPDKDLALIQYTGGTTGAPKGRDAQPPEPLRQCAASGDARSRSRQAARSHPGGCLPFFHVFANTCVLNRTVVTGGEIVMLPRFHAGQVLATLKRIQASSLPGVPTMFQALLDHPKLERAAFASLRFCISGGAPLPAELKTRFEAATGSRLVEGYGLSESSGVVSCNPYEALNKPGTIGQPIVGTRLRLVDKEDPTRAAPDGEPGELVIAGPQIMKGYWNRPQGDATVFVEDPATPGDDRHWLRTGDVATIDDDGFIRIVDRLKDMIAVSGFKVFPSRIEATLYHYPAIKEALVIGMPDSYRGEVPRAYVTLTPDAQDSGNAIKAWLNPQLGSHERVDQVVVRDSLPKTMIGKLSRKDLIKEVLKDG